MNKVLTWIENIKFWKQQQTTVAKLTEQTVFYLHKKNHSNNINQISGKKTLFKTICTYIRVNT